MKITMRKNDKKTITSSIIAVKVPSCFLYFLDKFANKLVRRLKQISLKRVFLQLEYELNFTEPQESDLNQAFFLKSS
jgi:hypothetical protein